MRLVYSKDYTEIKAQKYCQFVRDMYKYTYTFFYHCTVNPVTVRCSID